MPSPPSGRFAERAWVLEFCRAPNFCARFGTNLSDIQRAAAAVACAETKKKKKKNKPNLRPVPRKLQAMRGRVEPRTSVTERGRPRGRAGRYQSPQALHESLEFSEAQEPKQKYWLHL